MKKNFTVLAIFLLSSLIANAQTTQYPVAEFANEIYLLKKDNGMQLVRLEKSASKIESKAKLGGLGGGESVYPLDGERSSVRLNSGNNLSFVFSTASASSNKSDSMLKAYGIDPSVINVMPGGVDPSSLISLYKTEQGKGKRKILVTKYAAAVPFASKKPQSSDKFTFSLRKIKDGYWELLVDKTLPKGEYAFVMVNMRSMDQTQDVFAFAID